MSQDIHNDSVRRCIHYTLRNICGVEVTKRRGYLKVNALQLITRWVDFRIIISLVWKFNFRIMINLKKKVKNNLIEIYINCIK